VNRRLERWRLQARILKIEAHAVYYASKDSSVPWHAKALAARVVAYSFSPIDLIPAFIPVVGYLDDLVVVPAGLLLAIKLIPADVMTEHLEAARIAALERKPNLADPPVSGSVLTTEVSPRMSSASQVKEYLSQQTEELVCGFLWFVDLLSSSSPCCCPVPWWHSGTIAPT
jgi:uncharacterized membrane protein YkvA (DUF1232 family)